MKKISHSVNYPETLSHSFDKSKEDFLSRHDDYLTWFEQTFSDESLLNQLKKVWSCSQFATSLSLRRPDLFKCLFSEKIYKKTYSSNEISERLSAKLDADNASVAMDENHLNKVLRDFRNLEILRIIWRDFNRLSDLEETVLDISMLAEATVNQALDFHHRKLSEEVGAPTATINGDAVEQKLVVLGMGKLGAYELNLSSDIDLIFAYPEKGKTVGGKKSLDNQEFFTRLGQRLIQSIDQTTVDGFVFRVDMRLRPYGQSGALVLSFDAMEEYYQDQGREWERYAMIKARPISGRPDDCKQLITMLRPFVYRRYIDFSVIDALRSMKQMIQQEVKRRKLSSDVKLGAGGIREIEFIAQSFQLIRGGREPELQERRVQKILTILAEKNSLPLEAVEHLQQAYIFLRNTEHAIQAFNDRQTQALPEDDFPRAALAYVMGFNQWADFVTALDDYREQVNQHFHQVIADSDEEKNGAELDSCWQDFWLGQFEHDPAIELLIEHHHESAEDVFQKIQQLTKDGVVQRMQVVGRERLDQFMPLLLQAVAKADKPSLAFINILPLVEAVLRRTAYLVLLIENPGALQQLVILCAASPWISKQLARHPVLLDELLDSRTLYKVPEKSQLRDELQQQLLRIPQDDLEAHMEALRYFKQAHQLHVSAAEVTGKLPLMKVSDYLTIIAEVILELVLDLAWDNLIEKHGRPQRAEGVPCDKDFIIVGYGKVGGIEMGHSSDLDLVFIHDAASNMATDGKRPVDNAMFFARLGQRIIHILTTQTPLGDLYEVDMRLRPSGASGLLVSSLSAFEDYQRKDAWTWEHQALVRARVVAGDNLLGQRFEKLRQVLLSQPRNNETLRADVTSMRQKMRDHLGTKPTEQDNQFHLKHDAGGIVDIEFLTQYAVLSKASEYHALVRWSDNIRILESLQDSGVLNAEEANSLIEAYKVLRSATHRLALQQQENIVDADDFLPERTSVKALWQRWLG